MTNPQPQEPLTFEEFWDKYRMEYLNGTTKAHCYASWIASESRWKEREKELVTALKLYQKAGRLQDYSDEELEHAINHVNPFLKEEGEAELATRAALTRKDGQL